MHLLVKEDEFQWQGINKDAQHGIRPTAKQVAKGSSGYHPRKWPVEKIDDPNNDMSYFCEQILI